MPLERAEGLYRSGALRYQANPCPGPGGPGGGARAQRGPGAGGRDPAALSAAAYRALSTPSLHRIQTHNECVRHRT